MFRNPRENHELPDSARIAPSVGRPPSPPRTSTNVDNMAAKPAARSSTKAKSTPSKAKFAQTTLVPADWAKKAAANNGKMKPKAKPNGNIMAFFQKAEELNSTIFLKERGGTSSFSGSAVDDEEDIGWSDTIPNVIETGGKTEEAERYNENGGSIKRRKLSEEAPVKACSPPPPDDGDEGAVKAPAMDITKGPKKTGPFIDESDSEAEEDEIPAATPPRGTETVQQPFDATMSSKSPEKPIDDPEVEEQAGPPIDSQPPPLKTESTSIPEDQDFDEFEGLEDEEFPEGEEYDERRWMEEQERLEMAEAGFEGGMDNAEAPPLFPDEDGDDTSFAEKAGESAAACPICNASLKGLSEQDTSVHVNACLDGNPLPLPKLKSPAADTPAADNHGSKMFKKPPRPARPGQANPFQLGAASSDGKSAFSKLMAGHAEDAAWATAADAERKARGKPSYERTCPFYKILPGFYICVDAFRYGAVKGQNAYFLSHFHSDHYVGLTASWSHGPIYCSRPTANLVRQQLRVDPKWVVDLEFEEKVEVPGTEGVHVTMIPANHCPGSSLFLFEKEIGKGKNPRLQRVLHCGDFRACQAHIEHPLLRPDVLDAVSGKNRQQKLDVCYLDTTYLNPKYAFPPQQQVIQACADMCVSLNKPKAQQDDEWERMKRKRAGQGMVNFVQSDSKKNNSDDAAQESERGRLLVVVGTYSIGKERICMGIANALNSKIYAPPNKQKICRALEDPELEALLTTNPCEAQVHMTPLFEIRADTLEDYLRDYRDHFSRAVGFRPSGWNYRPPNNRFTESPTVQTVLHSKGWRSQFTMKDLTPQRGSTGRAACFGVPYSEHSSFRELTMFCCALRIDKIIPTVNVGSAKSREKMKAWCEKWMADKRKNGLFKLEGDGSNW